MTPKSESETGDQLALAEALRNLGATVATTKSGRLLRVDFRPVAGRVDDGMLRQVAGSIGLKELYLDGTAITAACAADLRTLVGLNVLDVQNTSLDDSSLEFLLRLPELKMLLVRGARVTPDRIRALRRASTKVRIIG